MSLSDLIDRLAALSDALKVQNSHISRLAKLPYQPEFETRGDKGSLRADTAQDIHESLKQLDYEFESLRQEADLYSFEDSSASRRHGSSAGDDEQARLSARLARLGEELQHSRQQFRNAQVTAKRAVQSAKLKEREALLESYRQEAAELAAAEKNARVDGNGAQISESTQREQLFAQRSKTQRSKNLTKDEVLVDASGDVTSALRRTHDLLATELSRSRFAQETFDESTAALAQLGDDYSSLDTILSNSRNLLGTLLRSQKSDTWYLETAFYILLATLVWLFFRRILFGPFIKLPLFLSRTFFFLANWILLKPLWFFLTATGVIISEPATSTKVWSQPSTSSRPPLIVHNSAARGLPKMPSEMMEKLGKTGMPVGAGGAGAKVGKEHSLSEAIGQMAEASEGQDQVPASQQQQEEDSTTNGEGDQKDLPRRGDGTILQERGDVPRNPKKKGFEADVEDTKHEQQTRQKRDEL